MNEHHEKKTNAKRCAVLYANGAFHNRGCEAIVRGASRILQETGMQVIMGTTDVAMDREIAQELQIQTVRIPRSRESFSGMVSELCRRAKLKKLASVIPFAEMKRLGEQCDYSFSIGGDNYCYGVQERFYRMNRSIRNSTSKNCFWGCSLEESAFDEQMRKDLEGFDIIFAREQRTYNMLLQKGLTNVVKCTDPAFVMEPQCCSFPGDSSENEYIGVNISPLTLTCSPDPEKTFRAVVQVLQEVLEQTPYDILLIPHVYGPTSDHSIHCKIAEAMGSDRVRVIPESYNAPQLKYIISTCKAFIGSRTHSTIAAYSTCVPTLTLGYSVKSVGIAEDLFGTAEGYVLTAQNGITYDTFRHHVMRLLEEQDQIRAHLQSMMDGYKKNAYVIAEVINNGKTGG